MVGSKHLPLLWSVAGRTSPGTATFGSCLQAPLDHSNSVGIGVYRHDVSPGGAVFRLAFLSVSVPFFVPVLPLDRNISGLKNFEMGRWPPSLDQGHAYLLEVVSTGSISHFSVHFS